MICLVVCKENRCQPGTRWWSAVKSFWMKSSPTLPVAKTSPLWEDASHEFTQGGALRRVSAAGVDPAQYHSLAKFRAALRRFLAFSEGATRAAGVTPNQYQALLAIKAHPARGMIIRELAEQMLLQHNGAVQLVDRLSAAGLVERRDLAADRRSVLVVLSRRGEMLLDRLAAAHIKELLNQEPLLAELLGRLRQMTTGRCP